MTMLTYHNDIEESLRKHIYDALHGDIVTKLWEDVNIINYLYSYYICLLPFLDHMANDKVTDVFDISVKKFIAINLGVRPTLMVLAHVVIFDCKVRDKVLSALYNYGKCHVGFLG